MLQTQSKADQIAWMKELTQKSSPSTWKSMWQIANSAIPFIALWGLMVFSLNISIWLSLALTIPTAGFMVRIFIIFHDAGHGSFFRSQKANHITGIITGILTFTPYFQWRHQHAIHHNSSGNLDKRGVGDVWTMTVEEYRNAPRMKRITYRLYRHPLVMLVIGPLFMFLVAHRFAGKTPARERWSVIYTNLALLAIAVGMSMLIGFKTYLLLHLAVLMLAGSAGVWLFYVQHQFEGVYWEHSDNWDFFTAAIQGSSFYKLPKMLQWFSGNIGFHHIHHLNARIPNYLLEKVYAQYEPLQQIEPITLRKSLKSLKYRLYDEASRRLVGFREARAMAGR